MKLGVARTHALEAAPADIALSVCFVLYFFEHVCSTLDVPLGDGVVDEFIELLVLGVLVDRELCGPGSGQCGGDVDVFVIVDASFPFDGRHWRCTGSRSGGGRRVPIDRLSRQATHLGTELA